MNITTKKKNDSCTCVEIEGRLDTLTAADFDVQMSKIIEKEDQILLDMSKCKYLSSNGIRSLMIINKKLASRERGKLILVALPPDVRQVLEIAGLHQVFQIADTLKDGIEIFEKDKDVAVDLIQAGSRKLPFEYQSFGSLGQIGWIWTKVGIAGYDELGIAAGTGRPAEASESGNNADGMFLVAGNFAAFVPQDKSVAPDFRITADPSQAGIHVNEACSFDPEANAFLRYKGNDPVKFQEIMGAIHEVSGKINKNRLITAFVIAGDHGRSKGVTIGVVADMDMVNDNDRKSLSFLQNNQEGFDKLSFAAVSLKLEEIRNTGGGNSLDAFLKEHVSFENVAGIALPDPDEHLVNSVVWLFIGDTLADAAGKRIEITAPETFHEVAYKPFLARRLYRDSSKLELKPLQGGFSAQTFQVTSWDAEGRMLRPTVLKLADRDMITREAKHCREYAMPYILNNSAMILGTEYFGDLGALRYNFVGIGGEESRLKWLTNYFLEWPPERLEPLFDKIFLKILKPWYGQTVKKTIYPYRDHDPTKTFFPELTAVAEDFLNISADDGNVWIPELDRDMTNPFWVLKHHYPKMENVPVDFLTSICHGDLNMQNILLDEQMNVYLIDFSETRPRSVVADFARLEAIFITEFIPINTEADLKHIVNILVDFYGDTDFEGLNFPIDDLGEEVRRNLHLSKLMRRYAVHHAEGENPLHPYFLAMLEWVLPVVCYRQVTPLQKRLSFILASLICQKLGIEIDN